MNITIFVWLAVSVFFLTLEMGHPGLFLFLSFSLGAAAAAIVSFWIDIIIVQCTVFLLGTVIALGILRYVIARWSAKKVPHHTTTNVYALRGKRGTVLKIVSSKSPGVVKIGGEVWAARSIQNTVIPVGQEVEVVDVIGVHVIVKKITE